MKIYIGIDDTDNHESRGTGHLARMIARTLADRHEVLGVTRHQLLFDPRVPYTAKNSCAAILLGCQNDVDLDILFLEIKDIMLADFQQGSDPGLCLSSAVPLSVSQFGARAKTDFIYKEEAIQLAAEHKIRLAGLGGTNDGVIGALAAVGLAASGEDGRYVQVGKLRELSGLVSIENLIQTGVYGLRTLDGSPITEGLVLAEKLRPARRESKAILFAHWCDDHWVADKLD